MNTSCPSCLCPFSPGPLTTPHLLSCRHSICRACLQSSSLLQCPVLSCHAHIPRLAVDMFPVNCHLLGEVMIRESRDSDLKVKQEKLDHNKIVDHDHASRNKLATILARSHASLAQLEKAKLNIDVDDRDSCCEEAASQLSSSFAGCHAQLELVGDKIKNTLRQEEEKRMIQDWDMTRDLLDIIDKPAASENDVNLVIDENIFSALETYLKIDTVDKDLKSPVHDMFKETPVYSNNDSEAFKTNYYFDAGIDTDSQITLQEMERVDVAWVDSPSALFIRRYEDLELSESLVCQLEVEKKKLMDQQKPAFVGQIVMVMCRGGLTRGRVNRIVQDTATVTYIDLGGSDHHPLAKLTVLSGQLSALPGLAIQCCLASVSPPTSTGWSSQATQALVQVTLHTTCLVSVLDNKNESNQLMVSLYLKPGEGMARDHMCSLEEYLVYKGWADWKVEGREARHRSRRYQKCFLRLAPWRQGEEQKVVVTHIEDPGSVSLQMLGRNGGYAESIKKLIDEMDKEYKIRVGDPNLRVLVPRVGMVCVAQLRSDKKPYRAQVMAVLGDGRVEIQFVDFGNKEVVIDKDLMKILDKFLTLPVMSTAVFLAGIVPVQSSGWEQHASRVLREKTRGKKLMMFLEKEKNASDLCQVVLYEMLPDKDVCINAWLVNEGHAVSLTGECSTLEYKKEIRPEPAAESDNNVEVSHHIPGMSGDKNPEKVACRVVNAHSPSSLFIRQLSDEENFYKLNEALQLHYKSMPDEDFQLMPGPGNMCAASLGRDGWARAKVVSLKGRNEVNLSLLDFGKMISLPVHCLRPLDNKFRFKNFVEEVHLVNLLPTGGTGKWTTAACEVLDEILDQVDKMVHVEMAGKCLGGTVPVKMFVKKVLDPGIEFVPVDETLVKAGLAIPAVNRKMSSMDYWKESKLVNSQVPQSTSIMDSDEDCDPSLSIYWPSPRPPPTDQFLAVASHVDWDGNVYLCTLSVSQENDLLRIIGNVLDSKYQGSIPRPVDRYWKVGQAAVTRWDLDGRWYRARVLGVNFDECTVKFVDYGTVEECKVDDMRKDLFMTEIPIQCFPLQLENISPVGGKWEQAVLDFLHSIVVDQTVTVTISSSEMSTDNKSMAYEGKLTTKAELDIGQLLVDKKYARVTENK